MKYSIECDVIGRVKIGKQIKTQQGNKEYFLVPNEKGWIKSIKIITKVEEPQKFSSRVEPGVGLSKATFIVGGDNLLRENLIHEFRELESMLSLITQGSVINILVDTTREEFIPENEDEKRLIAVSGITLTNKYPEYSTILDEGSFQDIIQNRHKYETLLIPAAFFKEGMNEFISHRYINAYYNFYFILEDFYGQGKTKNKDILEAFRSSIEFKGDFSKYTEKFSRENSRHRENIGKFLKEENLTYDSDDLMYLLIKIRGNLHHYSSKSSKHKGTPFNQADFESISLFLMGLTSFTLLKRLYKVRESLK